MKGEESTRQVDWYELLGLSREATSAEIAAAVDRLSRQASAMAVTAPERSQQIRDRVRAMKRDLLSGDEARSSYDTRLQGEVRATDPPVPDHRAAPSTRPGRTAPVSGDRGPGPVDADAPAFKVREGASEAAQQAAKLANRFVRFMRTGWTCSSCGTSAFPGDKFCQGCGGPLTQTPTPQPKPAAIAAPVCPSCSERLLKSQRFCTKCGAAVPLVE